MIGVLRWKQAHTKGLMQRARLRPTNMIKLRKYVVPFYMPINAGYVNYIQEDYLCENCPSSGYQSPNGRMFFHGEYMAENECIRHILVRLPGVDGAIDQTQTGRTPGRVRALVACD